MYQSNYVICTEVEYLPERTKLLFDPKIDKDFIKLGNFSGLDEEIRPLFTALHYIAELGHKEESRPYVKQFSSEVLKFVEFPESWTSEYVQCSVGVILCCTCCVCCTCVVRVLRALRVRCVCVACALRWLCMRHGVCN